MASVPVFLKLEGFNFSGSIKLKPARYMIEQLESRNLIQPGKNTIIESSSGNLAKALALVCLIKGYAFKAVLDVNVAPDVVGWLKAYGADFVIIDKRDANGGYLNSRIEYIKEAIGIDSSLVWLNQYANTDNPDSHFNTTAREIIEQFPDPDYIFVGTGTTGTIAGIAKYFKLYHPRTKLIGVDAVGSVTFGSKASKRFIPGIGTSRRPEISPAIDDSAIDDVVWVDEQIGIQMCHRLLKQYGLFCGGSTGSVIAGVLSYADRFHADDTIIALSPDNGDKYLNTIYSMDWVNNTYGFNFS